MDRRDELITITRAKLFRIVLLSAIGLAMLALCFGAVVSLIAGRAPPALMSATLAIIALRMLAALFEIISFYVRRSARRRRMRR